jgi:ribosomal protein S18 acetylase RimI-like enzyme
VNVTIAPATHPDDVGQVRGLFVEYANGLGVDLCFQNFEEELAGLPGKYTPPLGNLCLALVDAQPAGCIAVRRLEPSIAELKRLYVRPAYRGLKLGRQLTEAALAFAKSAGYSRIRLDTLPSMTSAQALYRSLGFETIEPYCTNPICGATYWEKRLAE